MRTMKNILFQITPHENGLPLVDVLSAHLKLSKRKAKTLLDNRQVFINGKRIWMAQHPVRTRDRIEAPAPEAALPPDRDRPIQLLWQNTQWLIADKPAGIVTNASPASLEQRLREQLHSATLCAVHRLDKDTSGCVLFARHAEAKARMIPLFRNQKIAKIYRAIVLDKFPRSIRTIHHDIDGESASTEVNLLDARKIASYLELRIRTGRTHQIRRHLQYVKHPVAGDKAYRNEQRLDERLRRLPRQMLHAHKLIFKDPDSGKPVRITAPVPEDFKAALSVLKLH
jgi:23S rRNA pseudouridine1911/1915/1917 synthase